MVNLEVRRDAGDRKSPVNSYRLTADAQGRTLRQWVLTNGEERNILASLGAEDAGASAKGVEVALAEIFEFRIPFALIARAAGKQYPLALLYLARPLPVDSLPLEGWIDLLAVPEEELENNPYSVAQQE